jgi:hypothetical protein
LVVNYRLLGSLKYDRLNIKIFSSSYWYFYFVYKFFEKRAV